VLTKEVKKLMAGMLDDEAELGSDDEDNDHVQKQINKNDDEENEEGLDEDLNGFVVQGNDEEINPDNEEEAYKKYLEQIELDDQRKKMAEINAVVYGRNSKKRRRYDVDDLDDEDDFEQRKQQRMLD